MLIRVILVSGLLFVALGVWGQKSENRAPLHYLSGYIYGGQIEIHSSKIDHFQGVRPFGAGVDFSWKFVSKKAYSLCSCYPSLGLSVNYWNFGHESLGNAVSTLFYVEPVLFSPAGIDLAVKAGMGVSYLDHPYNEKYNPLNVTYSTNFAFPLMIGLSADVPLDTNWSIRLSGIFQHISNGGVNQPNLGINYTTLGVGLKRKLDSRSLPPPIKPEPIDPDAAETRLLFAFSSGIKEPEDSEEKAILMAVSAEYLHQFARINAWSVGLQGEYDNSRSEPGFNNKSRLSLTAGHSFLLGRFTFGQKGGIYVWRGHSTHSPWYQYYTLDFDLAGRFGFGVGLKAHGKVAEYLGVRLLYKL
ncbi:acyloxyacyl hydrolase [Marinilabilia rubra]|uniref:Acyloxyacyl hydrolase n=1 Tax=Marinilabilia rubra TaxID=2162893 RepID=A0A2U2BDK0_9BACT|nr:acyloxyacyl hydrolase [Marinilabilia rubra]PWE01146.1 acyloxyacyl hydrolase [Marinilabilia rubra]